MKVRSSTIDRDGRLGRRWIGMEPRAVIGPSGVGRPSVGPQVTAQWSLPRSLKSFTAVLCSSSVSLKAWRRSPRTTK